MCGALAVNDHIDKSLTVFSKRVPESNYWILVRLVKHNQWVLNGFAGLGFELTREGSASVLLCDACRLLLACP